MITADEAYRLVKEQEDSYLEEILPHLDRVIRKQVDVGATVSSLAVPKNRVDLIVKHLKTLGYCDIEQENSTLFPERIKITFSWDFS